MVSETNRGLFSRFPANAAGRDFAVGDIHGHFDLLQTVLQRIEFDRAHDRLFSVGDLIDRGPESVAALDWLAEPWFHAIRGNHEQMLIDALMLGGDDRRMWRDNGGAWFGDVPAFMSDNWRHACRALPFAAEIAVADGGRVGLAHADAPADWRTVVDGLSADKAPGQLANTLMWSRHRAREIERRYGSRSVKPAPVNAQPVTVRNVDLICFGHTQVPRPIRCGNTRWLDTGVCDGRALTIAELKRDGAVFSLTTSKRGSVSEWTTVAADEPGTGIEA